MRRIGRRLMYATNVLTRTSESFAPPPPLNPAPQNRSPLSLGQEGGELELLRARADAGGALTPVEQGTLARLMDRAAPGDGASAPTTPATPANDPVEGAKTVDDFTVTNANAQDRADLQEALDYLQQADANGDPVSQTATDLLAKLPDGARINIIHDGNDSYNPNTNVINWDPRSGLVTSSGEGTQSAALGLIHEVDHEVGGISNPKPTGDAYDNTEEKRVITGSETTIAHDLHEPTRTDHRGGLAVMNSSIEHTEVAPPKEAPSIWDKIGDWFRNLF